MEPIVAFREYIFSDVLPAFGNLDARAQQMASDYYNRIGSQPVGEDCDIEMGSVAEDAQDCGVSWYQMMVSPNRISQFFAAEEQQDEDSLNAISETFDESIVARHVQEHHGLDLSVGAVFDALHKLSEQTYENKSLTFGCILDPLTSTPGPNSRFPADFLSAKSTKRCQTVSVRPITSPGKDTSRSSLIWIAAPIG